MDAHFEAGKEWWNSLPVDARRTALREAGIGASVSDAYVLHLSKKRSEGHGQGCEKAERIL